MTDETTVDSWHSPTILIRPPKNGEVVWKQKPNPLLVKTLYWYWNQRPAPQPSSEPPSSPNPAT